MTTMGALHPLNAPSGKGKEKRKKKMQEERKKATFARKERKIKEGEGMRKTNNPENRGDRRRRLEREKIQGFIRRG